MKFKNSFLLKILICSTSRDRSLFVNAAPKEPVPPVIRIFFPSNIIPNFNLHYNKLTANASELLIINNAFINQFNR